MGPPRNPPRNQLCRASIEVLEQRRLLALTYYVSPSGSDANTGISTNSPFKTLARVNSLNLEPGDSVLLQGGATFTSSLSSTNIARDPGLEAKSTSIWSESLDDIPGSTSFSTNSADVHSGGVGFRLQGSGDVGRGQIVTSLVSPVRQYLFKAWGKISGSTGAGYVGITFKRQGVVVAKFAFQISGSDWREYRGAIVAPEQFDFADIWCFKYNGSSVMSADDFSLSEITGGLALDSTDAGTAANPVVIGSYGAGRATIAASDGSAISLHNAANIRIGDLNLAGAWNGLSGAGTNAGYGVVLRSTLASDAKVDSVLIDNLDVSGFKYGGIVALGEREKAGFSNLRITNCFAHDNGEVGIEVRGIFDASSTTWSHNNVYVGWCRTYNNGGFLGALSNTGSGIKLGDVSGGTIERCIAYNNGQFCDFPGGGPVGIWAWDSNAVIIQHNESYANRTAATGLDGGGFDLDGGCTNCVLQYNYSHDNDGAGFLLWQFAGARAFTGNVVRYNISQNDARHGHYGAIHMGGGSGLTNALVHNNTIYLTPSGNPLIAAIKLLDVGAGQQIRSNIFITTGGVQLVSCDSGYSAGDVKFSGNAYYSSGSAFSIRWGGGTYSSLTAWRSATGQEKSGSINTGMSVNPMLVSAGGGGTIGDASRLHTLDAYQLRAGSPMINSGASGGGPLISDFYGAPATGSDIGAFDWSTPTINGTAGADAITLRSGSGGALEVFVNAPLGGTPTHVWASGVYDSVVISSGAGSDILSFSATSMKLSYFGGSGADQLNITAGTCTLSNDVGAAAPDVGVTVASGASAIFNVSQQLSSLTLQGAAKVVAGAGALFTRTLSISSAGQLDLNDNELIVDYTGASPFTNVQGWIFSGFSGGSGIISTIGQSSGGMQILVLLDNALLNVGEWDGRAVDSTSLISRFTYFADSNLDGLVSGDDLTVIDANLGTIAPLGAAWIRGDSNFDGLVTGDDYTVFDAIVGLI